MPDTLLEQLGHRRPIMVLLELLSRRWTLRVLWELRAGALTSRALREACDSVSPSVLQARIDDLREAGVVERRRDGYALTETGDRLLQVLLPLHDFAGPWAQDVRAAAGRD